MCCIKRTVVTAAVKTFTACSILTIFVIVLIPGPNTIKLIATHAYHNQYARAFVMSMVNNPFFLIRIAEQQEKNGRIDYAIETYFYALGICGNGCAYNKYISNRLKLLDSDSSIKLLEKD